MDLMHPIRAISAIVKQHFFDLSEIRETDKLILFILPPKRIINGGVMSIFFLCETTRRLFPDAKIVLATFPSLYTHAQNDLFENNEKIYRFSQIINEKLKATHIYIHIPEYLSSTFFYVLTKKQRKILCSISNLYINILNQNIILMPPREKLTALFKLTTHITQTTAHRRYATQEISDHWQIPLHHFSALLKHPPVQIPTFKEKIQMKIIVFSSDKNKYQKKIRKMIETELPDYTIITVKKMSYYKYFSLISKSMCVVSFGEGFDGYFCQPPSVGSLGIAVYNDAFFPDKEWVNLDNVYISFEEMNNNFSENLRKWEKNIDQYNKLIKENKEKLLQIYSQKEYSNNIARFYNGEYDFTPSKNL